ncbi:DUF1987 domain-containing protein [Oxalobacteraceae bacterium OM1]|nr:DUF1987 domain-containing protein [Oxalobacteraceae bacterium OM1]
MDNLHIDSTQSTPAIVADAARGVLEMRGDSYPENSYELFSPVMNWLEAYLAAGNAPLTLNLYLLYLNTSSVKAMMDIFDMLEAAHQDGRAVRVNWFYDAQNERVAELAEEFKEDCTFPFDVTCQVE